MRFRHRLHAAMLARAAVTAALVLTTDGCFAYRPPLSVEATIGHLHRLLQKTIAAADREGAQGARAPIGVACD